MTLFLYLCVCSLVSFVLMAVDKRAARRGSRRIPEAVLHLMELLGGAFGALLAMYIVRHKNRKFSFFFITYLAFLLWLGVLFLIFFQKYSA
ncbi:MAG: DUF1294 domain-containing protein [Bacteroidales bacterium]|nr:DUF1294 domain-containing protein [Bacteroidales bacterium]